MVPVKDEEVDWLLFCILSDGRIRSEEELGVEAGLEMHALSASLDRLSGYHLIERRQGKVKSLPFPEVFARYILLGDPDTPFLIEDGVIRVGKE